MNYTDNDKLNIEKKFDCYVKTAIENELINFIDGLDENEYLFSEINGGKPESLKDDSSREAFDEIETEFIVDGQLITIHNVQLRNALMRLSDIDRDILLMASGLNLPDREISEITGIERKTVNNRANKALDQVRKMMGVVAD